MSSMYGKTKRGKQKYDSVYNEAYHQYKLFYIAVSWTPQFHC